MNGNKWKVITASSKIYLNTEEEIEMITQGLGRIQLNDERFTLEPFLLCKIKDKEKTLVFEYFNSEKNIFIVCLYL